MIVENWMKRDVVTVRDGDDLLKADRLMTAYQIRHLPVLDDAERLCGILSDRDIRDHAPPPPKGKRRPARQQYLQTVGVSEAMTREVITIAAESAMERAIRLMKTRRIDALPVLKGDLLVGIITSTNLLAYFNDVLGIEAGWVRIELELGVGSGESIRLAENLGVGFSGMIARIDRESGRIRYALFLHKAGLDEAREAFKKAKIEVVRVQPLSE